VNYGSSTFYLYHDNPSIPLSSSAPITASCASGTVWSSSNGRCENVVLPVHGLCGTRSISYVAGTTAYPVGSTFCAPGNPDPANPAFPLPGGSVTWYCDGTDGGLRSGPCTASLAMPTRTVTISVFNPPGGKVTSSPSGISCGTTCVSAFTEGSTVELTATPSSTYWKFHHWNGDCSFSQSNKCTLLLDGDKLTSAIFVKRDIIYTEF
jgi:hypothetical protein